MKIPAFSASLALVAGSFLAFTGCSRQATLPEAPEAAMRKIADEIGAGHAGIIWTAMPASYQTDVTALIHESGTKLDAEVYDRGFGLLNKLADVLGKQRGFILSSQMAGQMSNKAKIEANWDSGVELLRTLANSKLSTVEGLKSFDAQAFLDSTGSKMLALAQKMSASSEKGSLSTQLQGTKFEVVNKTETNASLRVTQADGKTEVTEFTKVDARWVPSDMAAEWSEKIAEAKKKLAELKPEDMAKNKPQILGALAMAEGVISQLDAAKTQAEFDQALQGAMMPIMGLMMMGKNTPSGAPVAP